MQYLWINPVSAGMCEEDSLEAFFRTAWSDAGRVPGRLGTDRPGKI